MKDGNAEGFADFIMQQEPNEQSFENELVTHLIKHALESEDELSSSSSEGGDSHASDELEGSYDLQSSYLDIYDQLMRKYCSILNDQD